MKFDFDKLRIFPPGGLEWEADLPAILDYYQTAFFQDDKSVESAHFVASGSLGGPAAVGPQIGLIEVDERFRSFPKLCCFLILHELINHKLFHEHGSFQPYEGVEFQNELQRLWDAGAYRDLL